MDLWKHQGLLCKSQAVTVAHFVRGNDNINVLNMRKGEDKSFITERVIFHLMRVVLTFYGTIERQRRRKDGWSKVEKGDNELHELLLFNG